MAADDARWAKTGDDKREAVRSMFAEIAPTYDFMNSVMCARMHFRWRAIAVASLDLRLGDRALDVCCGTGDFTVPLRNAVGSSGMVVGVDFCEPMLDVARQKKVPAALAVGDACDLPFASSSFDAVTVGWGIRNVPDIDAAHREVARVLKPNGRFVSVDMARPTLKVTRSASDFAFFKVVPKIGALLGKRTAYTYLPESAHRFWNRERLSESMESAGLIDVRHRDFMLGNVCMHWGRKP